jgi:EAL domain-containing protein (putative c-di-GMP-specific phosphodiesterase class I)/GGDEF domain-containing protein
MGYFSLPSKEIQLKEPQEVEISYSEAALQDKLSLHKLSLKAVLSNLSIDLVALTELDKSEYQPTNNHCHLLKTKLQEWSKSQDIKTFANNINQLVFIWLSALEEGASVQNIIRHLVCFRSKTSFAINNSTQFHCFLLDIFAETTQKHLEIQLHYSLNYDQYTHLPNANQLPIELLETINNSHEHQLLGLLSIHFQVSKNNPVLSHATSIGLSKAITAILQETVSVECKLYFSDTLQYDLLIPNLLDHVQLNLIAAKIQRAFEQMIFFENQSILVTPFIGCAFNKKSLTEGLDLYDCSKLALENALLKQQNLVIYTETIKELLAVQNDLEKRVLEAFANDNLTLFFQPLVDLKESSCVGAELLLRWCEKSGYSVYPSLTVEILNKVGKGKLFTRWLINSACRYAAELKHEHKLNLYLTINLRAEDLYDAELPHMLIQALALWKLSPANIVLELTEDGFLELNETTDAVIKQLTNHGFKLALDDFGTGFSSLSRLRTMPIALIKIDQSFVRDITHSKEDFEIVKSIAMLANSLGKEVLVEGVEDKACLDLIKKMKIHKCQGYFYSKPLPFNEFITWAREHNPKLL